MHEQLVPDSFVTLVEQNYLPITKPNRKTSALKENQCFGILRSSSPQIMNSFRKLPDLCGASVRKKIFLPISLSCLLSRSSSQQIMNSFRKFPELRSASVRKKLLSNQYELPVPLLGYCPRSWLVALVPRFLKLNLCFLLHCLQFVKKIYT